MTTTIHVDRDKIASNFNKGREEPVFVVEKDGVLFRASEIEIAGPSRVIYSTNPHPVSDIHYSMNVRAWIETESEVIKIR
tara:strand:+ start:827 stop:1066 length:240 start_codon:yes stop_codon:yes gene_type:complete